MVGAQVMDSAELAGREAPVQLPMVALEAADWPPILAAAEAVAAVSTSLAAAAAAGAPADTAVAAAAAMGVPAVMAGVFFSSILPA